MQTHESLTPSNLWQPGEFTRRMMGERPSPVPPTRDLWPPVQQPLSISTLHVAYMKEDELSPRRASTLPLQPYSPTTIPIEPEYYRSGMCSVGTNTDPPQSIIVRFKRVLKRERRYETNAFSPPVHFTPSNRDAPVDIPEYTPTERALNSLKKVFSGAKYRIAPRSETTESPKIVYDMPKPGDRMVTTFGASETRQWLKLPSRASCVRRLRAVADCCHRVPQRPPRRTPQPRSLQITQVIALICGLLVVILMVLGLASADWLMAAGWRQGLFMHCIDPEAPTPLPFDIIAQPGCYAARPATYIKSVASVCSSNRSVWEFGWAYGVGWGAAIFLFGAVFAINLILNMSLKNMNFEYAAIFLMKYKCCMF
ncbi:unnamed protein product [Leptidea sinapis]|uniref:Uncharacterized protein n=1 Tax=Leptidea sinapis TaxID=189913 RepID=A0A5E4Q0H6_9NEOP|nr:unnamed protein product [Leptidea sinapis]